MSRRSSSSSSPSRHRRASAAAASDAADRKNRAASHTTPSRRGGGGGGDGGVDANAGSGSVEGWVNRKRREFPCASSSRSSGSGGGSSLRGAAGGGNGGGSGQKQTTGAMDMEVEEKRGGGERSRRGVDIASFSPYAARLGWGGSGITNSPGDEVGRAMARLAGLQFEHGDGDDGDDQEWAMESPAKKHHHNDDTYRKDSASPAPTEGGKSKAKYRRRGGMHFFKEADAPPPPPSPPPPPPPAAATVERSPEITAAARAGTSAARAATAAAAAAAVIPVENMIVEGMPAQDMAITSAPFSKVGGLRQEGGDESMASPPSKTAATERRTLVVYPPECLLHMGVEDHENHQEKPKRLDLLCGEQGALRRTTFQGLEWVDPSFVEPALITDLLRVHEYDYLERCAGAPPSSTPLGPDTAAVDHHLRHHGRNQLPPPPQQQQQQQPSNKKEEAAGDGRGGFGRRFEADVGYVDVDTRVSRESYGAARTAAGAVILAVDRVVQGKNPNAFVAVRPPGHHAGPSGSVPASSFWKNPGMNSSGFCLLNNAAIGAAYARCRYGRSGELSRVAIVDIDIHHGNGTEEIVRCLRPMNTRLPLPPSWPPMTKTVYKPWLDDGDADNVFFGSVSLQDKDLFYPASGTEDERFNDNDDNIVNVSLSPLGPTPGDEPKKRALTKTKVTEYTNKACNEFKQKCQRTLLARLKEFSPDLLIISAGFDGHVEDYYHYLSNEVYEWVTLALADCCPTGRVVSVLEGGYSLEARMSRAKAAQQARANNKRAYKPETAAAAASTTSVSSGVGGASASGSGSGPALRERRNRPATRGSGGGNAQHRPPPQVVATAAAAAGSAASFPQPHSSSVGAPGTGNKADSKAAGAMLHTVPAAVPTAAGVPLLSSAPAGSNTIATMGASSLSPSDQRPGGCFGATSSGASSVVGEDPAVPVAVVCGASVSSGVGGIGDGNRKKTSRKVPVVAAAKGEGEDAAIRAWDGGLVRGVVSHVSALMTCASRQQQEQQRLQQQSRPGPNTKAAVAGAPAASSARTVGGK
ncbi:unnamed protein product [Ectocarpus sp. CCAP 1310/34]|nr:unnamed protein product [Ectocarpus sp. CCAP 1310/34]